MADLLVRRWLTLLLLAPILAMVNTLLFPRRPQALPLPPPPNPVGGSWELINEQPARHERDLDFSPSRTYALQGPLLKELPVADLKLNLTSLAVRNTPNFQVAFLSATHPPLQLEDRRLLPIAGNGQLAIGHVADRPAWQTCLLPNGRPAVTRAMLRRGLFRDRPPTPKWALLLGIRDHPAHRCLLVTISTEGSASPGVSASVQPLVEAVIADLATRS